MNIHDKLNDFKFKIDDDEFINSKDLKGQNLIVYFYPKDDTPGCTVEAIDFSKSKNKFSKLNTKIFGVSKDSTEKHKKFINKHSLTIDLISLTSFKFNGPTYFLTILESLSIKIVSGIP